MENLDLRYKKAIDLHKDGYFHLALPVLVDYILSSKGFSFISLDAFVLLVKICSECQLDFRSFNTLLKALSKRIPGKYLELAEFLKDSKEEFIKSKAPDCLEHTRVINEFFESGEADSSSKIKALIKLKGRQNLRQDNHIYNEIIESDSKLRAVPISAQVRYKNSIEGNIVTALQHIPPGYVIYTEKRPIIFMINDKYKRNHCSFCCQKVGRDRVFCPKKCIDIVYCSDACRSLNMPCHDILCDTVISSSGFYGVGLDQNSQLCAQFAANFLSANANCDDPLSFGGLPYLHYPCLENNFYETSLEHFEKLLKDFFDYQVVHGIRKAFYQKYRYIRLFMVPSPSIHYSSQRDDPIH
ncbi:hypothetical protein DSO57_1007171 [Entomophthora muscae]|uniref:Uncharacterized protein n=1 Tax=Entomophthora muscae TaxID=34485 RepID=A0ACC2U5E8_9FUNG|nr:hypothetical protein DSO57_1007171 [Entomophthora muscae]